MDATDESTTSGREVGLEQLSPYDCWRLVTAAGGALGVARVVWSEDDRPAVVPVNYTVADGSIWFQTTPGSRLARACSDREVLVEVDHVDPVQRTGWSVVVTGRAGCLSSSEDRGMLGDLQVWPAGSRQLLVRVQPDLLTGRRLRRR